MNTGNNSMERALEIVKGDFTSLVNDNYELVVNENKELNVRIPSLEKRDEYVYKSITEYPYPLVMCMRIQEVKSVEVYNLILSKFMEFYKDKLDLFFKDVNSVDRLKENIVKTKRRIDNTTYASILVGILSAIILCIFKLSETVKYVSILGIILFFIFALVLQLTKENQVKNVIDAYLSIIKTEWYKKELYKQHAFFCNFVE
jgi:hypothetical protein